MKKLFILSLLIFPLLADGQISFENFENYAVGSLDSQLDTNLWTSTFTVPTIRTNAKITDAIAYSGTKCLSLAPDSNEVISIVGKLPLLNSGVAEVSFMQYVMLGYHNSLFQAYKTEVSYSNIYFYNRMNAHYVGANSRFVYSNDIITPYYQLPIEEWVAHKYVMNFDIDTGYFYLNDSLIVIWDLNESAYHVPTPLKQWQVFALNSADSTDKAYYDDFRVVQYPTSTHQPQSLIEKFGVFPNPTINQFNYNLELKKRSNIQYNILDVNGRIVKGWLEKEVLFSNGHIDISNLPNGVYFLQAITPYEKAIKKIMIQRN